MIGRKQDYCKGFLQPTAVIFLLIGLIGGFTADSSEMGETVADSTKVYGDVKVEHVDSNSYSGNLGYGDMIAVSLENGTTLSYRSYTNNHPLCQGMPEEDVNGTRCEDYGETTRTAGFEQARALIEEIGDERQPSNLCYHPGAEDLFVEC